MLNFMSNNMLIVFLCHGLEQSMSRKFQTSSGGFLEKVGLLHVFECLCGFSFFFLYFLPLVTKKVVLALILTRERRAEHPFTGQNTQQQSSLAK